MRIGIALALVWAMAAARLGYDRICGIRLGGIPPRQPIAQFPMEAPGPEWRGYDVPLEPATVRLAGVSQYLNRSYRRNGCDSISFSFYVGYYNGSTVEALHTPEVCFQGFDIEKREVIDVPSAWMPLRFNLLEFKTHNRRRVAAYTFFYKGGFEPDESAIRKGRAFSSRYFAELIVTAEFVDRGDISPARSYVREFISSAVPPLKEFFPIANP